METMGGLYYKVVVPQGTTVTVSMKGAPLPCSITAVPLDGDSVTINYSTDDGNNYLAWSLGTVTTIKTSVFDFPVTHVQCVVTGTGVRSSMAIC